MLLIYACTFIYGYIYDERNVTFTQCKKRKTMNIDAMRYNTRELCELTLRRNNVDLYSVRKPLAENFVECMQRHQLL